MIRVASRRHVFEANTNRFSLIPNVQRTKPVNNLGEDASIRHGEPCGVDPIHDLGVRLHPSPAALKEQVQDHLQAHLCLEEPQQCDHERPQGIFQQQRANRHDRLLAKSRSARSLVGPKAWTCSARWSWVWWASSNSLSNTAKAC